MKLIGCQSTMTTSRDLDTKKPFDIKEEIMETHLKLKEIMMGSHAAATLEDISNEYFAEYKYLNDLITVSQASKKIQSIFAEVTKCAEVKDAEIQALKTRAEEADFLIKKGVKIIENNVAQLRKLDARIKELTQQVIRNNKRETTDWDIIESMKRNSNERK